MNEFLNEILTFVRFSVDFKLLKGEFFMNFMPLQNFGSHALGIANFNLGKSLNRLHIVIGAAAFAALALIAILWSRCIHSKSSSHLNISPLENLDKLGKKESVLEKLVVEDTRS